MKNKKRIIFYYASTPSIMIHRIAKRFHKKGYETILFAMCEKDRFDYQFYSEAFDKIECSNFQFFKLSLKTPFYFLKRGFSLMKFLISMKFVKPYIVMGISGNNWQLKLIHKYFLKKYPFIYFPYDILSIILNENKPPQFEINAEKYCFENSDGIIHKGDPDELKFFNNKMNLSKFQLSFLPYCSNESIIPINKNKFSSQNKEIHLVYIGFFYNDPHSLKKFIKCFKIILQQKIHIHIYTRVSHIPEKEEEKYIHDFFKPLLDNKYFHLHKLVGKKETIQEISRYDFGFWPIHAVTKESKIATGNKLAGFLEAGLPFIYDQDLEFVDKLMKKWGMDNLSYNEKNLKTLKKRLMNLNYKNLLKKLEKARKNFDLDKNFSRLEKFIARIVERKNF